MTIRKWKVGSIALLVALCLVCVSGCGGNAPSSTAPEGSSGTESSATEQVAEPAAASDYTGTVTLIHVNDVHTHIAENDKAIGYAKIAGYAQQVKAENPNTLLLDNGDTFSGTANSAIDKAESLMPIINSVGFDVMVTGNHDYSYGSAHLLKLAGMLDHPVICANMVKKENDEAILDEYTIHTLDNGMKVGVIGLTTPTSASMGAADLKYIDAIATGQRLVDELKPQVDLIVGLCHIGDTEGDPMTSVMVANAVEGLDVIIDGHSHTKLPEGRVENGILIAQTGEYCQNIGVVDLAIENGKLVDAKARLISKEEAADIPGKEDTAKLVAEFIQMSEAYFAEVIGETAVQLVGTRDLIRTQETNIGSLFADVMREAAGAEVGMFKAGPIGGELEPGPITRKDLVDIARVNSMIIVKEMTGADIIEFLNYSLAAFPEPSGSFQQVSGISFVIDPELTEDKVFDIKVNGEPLDLERVYTVATIMGSDEEPGAVNGTFVKEVEYSMELMGRYIEANSPINCATDGRISTGTKPAA